MTPTHSKRELIAIKLLEAMKQKKHQSLNDHALEPHSASDTQGNEAGSSLIGFKEWLAS